MGIYPHRHTRCGCGGRPAREEVNDADRGARSTLVNLLIPRLIEVLGLSESVLDAASQPGAPGGMSGLRAAALHAALAWLRAGSGPNLHSPFTPTTLTVEKPPPQPSDRLEGASRFKCASHHHIHAVYWYTANVWCEPREHIGKKKTKNTHTHTHKHTHTHLSVMREPITSSRE